MSYDENDARAEWHGRVQGARRARAIAKALKRAKSPKFKTENEKAKSMTKENSTMYGKYMQ